jgi:energy-coupling factor transporter ATP-binding protein EcfA2
MNAQAQDPFAEDWRPRHRHRMSVLGSVVDVASDSRELMRLAEHAFDGLPAHRLTKSGTQLRLYLKLADTEPGRAVSAPPCVELGSGAGLLYGTMDAVNFAMIAPRENAALVSVSREMLRFGYHVRYELIEFAMLTLAARVNKLVSLHAACVGAHGDGALLLGQSGAGKSTLCLQALLQGCEFLAEDSVFVDAGMLATAVPAFLHVRCDARAALSRDVAALIRGAEVIRRRSGVRKFELDVRRAGWTIAPNPLRLRAAILLTTRSVRRGPLLRPLSAERLLGRLRREQPYAARQPHWQGFCRRIAALPAFEMRRGATPADSALALRALLDAGWRGARK